MYAVIKTGGKQYLVEPGMTLEVEKLEGEKGQSVSFNEVLLVSSGKISSGKISSHELGADDTKVTIGQPSVKSASVSAEIVSQTKGEKLKIFKKRKRHGYQLRKGHRQELTRVQIKEITG